MHQACVQGNADILKILLLACPNRAIQFSLLKSRDKRAMDCRKLVSVGRDEWQSAGVTKTWKVPTFLHTHIYNQLAPRQRPRF